MSLLPGASSSLKVNFDPAFKVDRISGIINGRITISHADHPHVETV